MCQTQSKQEEGNNGEQKWLKLKQECNGENQWNNFFFFEGIKWKISKNNNHEKERRRKWSIPGITGDISIKPTNIKGRIIEYYEKLMPNIW